MVTGVRDQVEVVGPLSRAVIVAAIAYLDATPAPRSRKGADAWDVLWAAIRATMQAGWNKSEESP